MGPGIGLAGPADMAATADTYYCTQTLVLTSLRHRRPPARRHGLAYRCCADRLAARSGLRYVVLRRFAAGRVGATVRSRGSELRGAGQGIGGQHRRRADARDRCSPSRFSPSSSTTRSATTGPTSGCRRSTTTPTWRPSTGRTQTSPTDQTRFVKQAVGVFATPAAAAPHSIAWSIGPLDAPADHADAPGQRRDAGLVLRRRPAARPTRPGTSRRPAPTADVSHRPVCGKTCCCKPKSVSPATVVRRSMCWREPCRTRSGNEDR